MCGINSSLSHIANQSVVYFNIAQAGTRFISMSVFHFLGSSVLLAFDLETSLVSRSASIATQNRINSCRCCEVAIVILRKSVVTDTERLDPLCGKAVIRNKADIILTDL